VTNFNKCITSKGHQQKSLLRVSFPLILSYVPTKETLSDATAKRQKQSEYSYENRVAVYSSKRQYATNLLRQVLAIWRLLFKTLNMTPVQSRIARAEKIICVACRTRSSLKCHVAPLL
jgi:hypothetical protein